MREILVIGTGGFEMVGTYHRPRLAGRAVADDTRARDVAFVLLNAGHLPRDGHAGLLLESATDLARSGYPVFRFDLPGLGDSPGDVPADLDDLFEFMNAGGYLPPTLALVAELRARFGLRRFVLGGLCGGAIVSVFAAARAPELVAGVLALELELSNPAPTTRPGIFRRLVSRAAWLRLLTGHSRLSRRVPPPAWLLPRALGRALLPDHANLPLLQALDASLRAGVPALLVMAGGRVRDEFYGQVRRAVLDRRSAGRVRHRPIPGTNHIFTTGLAKERVVTEIGSWSRELFAPWSADPVPAGHEPWADLAALGCGDGPSR